MKPTKIVKQIAGFILIVTFFLPLSRCEMRKVEVQQAPLAAVGQNSKVIDPPKISPSNSDEESNNGYNIPYKMFSAQELLSWLMLLSFFWPVPVLMYFYLGKRKAILTGITVVEPFFCIGAGYMVWAISTLGEILFAGCLALGAIISYFIASCYDNYIMIKRIIENKRGEHFAAPDAASPRRRA
jgi:hypothetical protein